MLDLDTANAVDGLVDNRGWTILDVAEVSPDAMAQPIRAMVRPIADHLSIDANSILQITTAAIYNGHSRSSKRVELLLLAPGVKLTEPEYWVAMLAVRRADKRAATTKTLSRRSELGVSKISEAN